MEQARISTHLKVQKLKPGQMSHEEFEAMWAERDTKIPWGVTVVHLLFLAWTVFNAHYPALFIGGMLFFSWIHGPFRNSSE